MLYLGIDVGTTGVKAAVFDEAGQMQGYGFRPYPILFGENQCAEQDAEYVWGQTKKAIREAVASWGDRIAAVSVSVQGDAVIPVDKNCQPIHRCVLGMDYRSEPQAVWFEEKFGAKYLFDKTGMRPHPINSIVKIKYLEENFPGYQDTCFKYMTYSDYILMKLGAEEPCVDLTMSSRYMAMDLASCSWDEEILRELPLSASKLSRICPSGTWVGNVKPSLAAELGLSKQAAIYAGGHDQPCAAIGSGLVRNDGLALDSHGTAEVISVAFDRSLINEHMFEDFYPCTYHVQKERSFTFALNHTGGVLFQWYKNEFCGEAVERARKEGVNPYTYLIAQLKMDVPSKIMVLPYFNGSGNPDCDLQMRGAFVGLDMNTQSEDILKGILDSLAFEMRLNAESLISAGVPVEKIRCVGGASRSDAWLQLKADIYGMTVETLETAEGACLGAAMIAAVGSGHFASYEEAAEQMVRSKKVYNPRTACRKTYDESFSRYKELKAALKPFYRSGNQ